MKKAVVVILSLMILSVTATMSAILVMEPQAMAEGQQYGRKNAVNYVWSDVEGRCSAEISSDWESLNKRQAETLFAMAKDEKKASAHEQAALMENWMNTGDSMLFISPDHRSSVIISCRTMDMELTDSYVSNMRDRHVWEVNRNCENLEAIAEMDSVLPQTGNRIAGMRCDNEHPSAWLLDMENASTYVYFTWNGCNLYTIVISDADVQMNADVHNLLFDHLVIS